MTLLADSEDSGQTDGHTDLGFRCPHAPADTFLTEAAHLQHCTRFPQEQN